MNYTPAIPLQSIPATRPPTLDFPSRQRPLHYISFKIQIKITISIFACYIPILPPPNLLTYPLPSYSISASRLARTNAPSPNALSIIIGRVV
jgi:hypothetical protein